MDHRKSKKLTDMKISILWVLAACDLVEIY
jgi:hypothetical protein